jgi:pilus assembly protein Flp/PilA
MPVGRHHQTELKIPSADRMPWCAMLLSIVSDLSDVTADLSGVTALEYGLIAALIAVVIITAVSALGSNLGLTFSALASHFTNGTVN